MLDDVGVPVPVLPALLAAIADDRRGATTSRSRSSPTPATATPIRSIVYDPADRGRSERAQEAFREVMELAIELGGTITGEHGVGRSRRRRCRTSSART